MNKYNVMITYAGEGSFKFTLRKIGEVEIMNTRPIYIYNADVDTINNLRALRGMLISIKIGAKPTGAFRIYNMDDYVSAKTVQVREHVAANYKEPVSNAEISSILKAGSTPEQELVTTKEDKVPAKKTADKAKKETAKKTTKKTTKK